MVVYADRRITTSIPGWGTWGFCATPVCGKRMAEMLATARLCLDLLIPFRPGAIFEHRPGGRKGRGVGGALSRKP